MAPTDQSTLKSYLDWANQGHPAWWRYVLTIVLTCILWFALPIVIIVLLRTSLQKRSYDFLLLPYSFLPAFLVILIVVAWILRRPGWTIALPQWPPRFAEYFAGVVLGVCSGILLTVTSLPFLPFEYQGFEPLIALGLPMIGTLLVGLMIQTGFEELLFRGLLTQFAYHLFHSPILAIGAQALIFGALHIGNVTAWHGDAAAMIPYVCAGLALGLAAWRTGSLMMPAGLHFANNSFNTLVVSTKGDVLPSLGPLATGMPTLHQAALLSGVSALLTVLLVELYVRARSV